MLKSELLKQLRAEISRHDLDTFRQDGSTVPGCPACRKMFYTVSQYNDHLLNDVLPALLDRLTSDSGESPDEDYIDAGYWADPGRNIRRKSGEQDVILSATRVCSKTEWLMLLAGLGMNGPLD